MQWWTQDRYPRQFTSQEQQATTLLLNTP